jgi:diguanylate cyclase (GGDEF)-like protein
MDHTGTPLLSTTLAAAAAQWTSAIAACCYLGDDDPLELLSSVLAELVDLALADPPHDDAARPIGARLAQFPLDQIRIVAPTVQTLLAVAPTDGPAARRWAAVVGQAVDGYSEALRERSLHQQEQILAAAISVRTSEVITLQEQLRHQATHDALTGLANRAHLQDSVDALLAAPLGLGLLIIDLDGFKFINDRYGHAVGDEVLVVVARRLRAYARSDDLVARYGGDEFIVATRYPEDEVRTLAERMVVDLREPFLTSAGPISVAASIGIAYHDGTADDDFTSLLRAADHEMYEIKAERGGMRRNIVEG